MTKRNYAYLFLSEDSQAENWRRSAPLPELAKALKEHRTEQLSRAAESGRKRPDVEMPSNGN